MENLAPDNNIENKNNKNENKKDECLIKIDIPENQLIMQKQNNIQIKDANISNYTEINKINEPMTELIEMAQCPNCKTFLNIIDVICHSENCDKNPLLSVPENDSVKNYSNLNSINFWGDDETKKCIYCHIDKAITNYDDHIKYCYQDFQTIKCLANNYENKSKIKEGDIFLDMLNSPIKCVNCKKNLSDIELAYHNHDCKKSTSSNFNVENKGNNYSYKDLSLNNNNLSSNVMICEDYSQENEIIIPCENCDKILTISYYENHYCHNNSKPLNLIGEDDVDETEHCFHCDKEFPASILSEHETICPFKNN